MKLYDLNILKKMLGVNKTEITIACKNLFSPIKSNGTLKYMLTKDQAEEIAIRLNRYEQFINYEKAEEQEDAKSIENSHPLVTDKRWLKLSEFPDVNLEGWEI